MNFNGETIMVVQYDNVISGSDKHDKLRGSDGNDYLFWSAPGERFSAGLIGLAGRDGDDRLEASVPGWGQIHMFGGAGNDEFILDLTNETIVTNGAYKGWQSHHAYGGSGADVFEFTDIDETGGYVA